MMDKENQPALSWDLGTAYDLFVSLAVLHQPEDFGLRASWAAGVRSRLPTNERKILDDLYPSIRVPLHFIYALPQPKDGATALDALRAVPAPERLSSLVNMNDPRHMIASVLQRVAKQGSWDERDLEALRGELRKLPVMHSQNLAALLDCWAQPLESGERFLAALETYYEVFFAEEEKRIAPALQAGLEEAKKRSRQLSLPDLLEELSQGVHFDEGFTSPELILAPTFWSTPLVIYHPINPEQMVFLFGARPANMSLVPGEFVPDMLIQALKALGDPTRLRILRYLVHETLTPSELSRRLRLRAPTVTHHLRALRLAGLVHLTLQPGGERCYTARLERLRDTYAGLDDFLEGKLD